MSKKFCSCLGRVQRLAIRRRTNCRRMNNLRPARKRRGAMLILILVMLVGFMATVAFSIDIAHMHLSRTELRSATDAASRAASQELARSSDKHMAIQAGQRIALLNRVDGEPLQLDAGDFEFGRSEPDGTGRFVFTAVDGPLNTVRVTGRRPSDWASGAISLRLGNVLGFNTLESQVTAVATCIERDLVLVIDRSGSMEGSEFSDLQGAIDVFIETLTATPIDEKVGLASCSEFATDHVQLTTNLPEVSAGLAALSTGGRTGIGRGMEAGEAIISAGRSKGFVQRTLIVMTDGMHGEGADPSTVAMKLAADRIQIHTITFGRRADQASMKNVAAIGGGRHFHALNAAELVDAYREIALTSGTVITE